MTAIRSEISRISVELEGDEEDGLALVPLGDDPLVDILDGADVEPASGLGDDEGLGRAVDLARDNGLLLVPAGHRARRRGSALAAADVELADEALGVGPHGGLVEDAAPREGPAPVGVDDQVLVEPEVEDEAVLVTVLGDVPESQVEATLYCHARELASLEDDAAGLYLGEAGDGANELGLAVAVYAAEAEDLARAKLEGKVPDAEDALRVADIEASYREHDISRPGGSLVDVEVDLSAHHHLGHALLGSIGHAHRVHEPAPPEDGAGPRDLLDLLELVRDEQDGLALADEPAHDLHELPDLLRRQDGRGLVEDEDLRVAVEHLEDLDSLLHADRDVLDLGLGIDIEAVEARELAHAGTGFFPVYDEAGSRLEAEDDVLGHGEIVHELEVLVHHADAQLVGGVGVGDPDFAATHPDRARVGLVQAEQDAHQGRLARAVFSEKRVDRALLDPESHFVVRADAREILRRYRAFR